MKLNKAILLLLFLCLAISARADNPKITMDEYDDVQWLIYSGNTANKATGLIVRNEDNSASGRNIAGFYLRTNNGSGGEYSSSIHAYGESYDIPAFRGYVNFSNDGGSGTILRCISSNAADANIKFFAGSTGGFSDEVMEIKDGDVRTKEWTDYSASSTVTGWASFTTKDIRYKKLGKTVYVNFYLAGTSDSSSVSFTLPYASGSVASSFRGLVFGEDAGTNVESLWILNTGSSTINFHKGVAATEWTASGSKRVVGQLWYESQS